MKRRQELSSMHDETTPFVSSPDTLTETERRKLERAIRKKVWLRRIDWFFTKVKAIGWIVGATYIIYQSNFFHVIFAHPSVNKYHFFTHSNRIFFNISLVAFGISIALLLYLSVYLPYIVRIQTEPEEYSPNAIPIATVGIIISFLTGLMGLWPVWGWYTFPLMLVISLGLYKVHHFLPSNFLGIVLQLTIGVVAVLSPIWIPHEGKWHRIVQS